jgi:transposase
MAMCRSIIIPRPALSRRRYRRRWQGERTFAGLGNCRLGVRAERRLDMAEAFFPGACLIITRRPLGNGC